MYRTAASKSRWIQTIVASFLLTLLTFPAFEPDYTVGLDSSYVWGFNYLLSHDYPTLLRIVHPYGPLAMLRLPLIEDGHFVVFLLFFSMLKILFAAMSLRIAVANGWRLWIAALLLVLPCMYIGVDGLVVFDVVLMLLLALSERRVLLFACAAVLATIGLMIKSSIGVASLSAVFVAWAIAACYQHGIVKAILWAIVALACFGIVGIAVYGKVHQLYGYIEGIVHSVGTHADTMVIETHLPLWRLAIALCLLMAVPLFIRHQPTRILYLLLLLPLMASYKHGVIRGDFWHYKQFAAFVAAYVIVIPLTLKKPRIAPLMWSALCFSLILSISSHTPGGEGQQIAQGNPANTYRMTIGYNTLKQEMMETIAHTKSQRALPDSTLQTIGTATIDFYPWEQVFAAANPVNWQPRRTFEMASSLSPWHGALATTNYSADSSAATFVLFHPTAFGDPTNMNAIDESYLLSEEPAVVRSLINNYRVADSGWYGLLLRHIDTTHHQRVLSPVGAPIITRWGQWVALPTSESTLWVKPTTRLSLYGHIKKIAYKTCLYYVDYMLPDGTIATHRYLPTVASEGLWASPYIASYAELASYIDGTSIDRRPTHLRFRTTHPSMVCDKIEIDFMTWE